MGTLNVTIPLSNTLSGSNKATQIALASMTKIIKSQIAIIITMPINIFANTTVAYQGLITNAIFKRVINSTNVQPLGLKSCADEHTKLCYDQYFQRQKYRFEV